MQNIKFIFIYLGFISISSMAIISCSDDDNTVMTTPVPVDSSDFRYPFTDGSSWSYTMTTSASDIKPDSILQYFNFFPIILNGTVTILYDTIINSIITKCFLDEFTNTGISYSNRYYYINNDTALILYASRQSHLAAGMLPLRKIRNVSIELDNRNLNGTYSNELELLEDSLYCTLKYPMTTGTEWSYITNGITASKKYLGFENISGPTGDVSCMKEKVIYSYNPADIYYNYYSKFGLMANYWFSNDIAHTTIANPDGDGTFDITQETVITSFNIP